MAATSASAAPGAQVTVHTRAGESREERATAAVHSSTYVNLRDELAKKLAAATGGSFHLR